MMSSEDGRRGFADEWNLPAIPEKRSWVSKENAERFERVAASTPFEARESYWSLRLSEEGGLWGKRT